MRTLFLFLISVCSLIAFTPGRLIAQSTDTSALMTVSDMKELSPHEFQYAVFLTNTGKVAIPLRGYSWGINLSKEMQGAQLVQTYVSRDEGLNALPKPNVTFHNRQLKGTTTNAPPGAEYMLQPGKKICLATVRVLNHADWPSNCYNPFLPPAGKNPEGAGAMQVVSEGGKSQCLVSCAGYMIYANANGYTSNSVYGLRVDMQPAPDSEKAFKLNCK